MKTKGKKAKPGKKEFLTGYPHYPDSEDIMSPEGNAERIDTDVENLSRSRMGKNSDLKKRKPVERGTDSSPEIIPGTEADVTGRDLETLGPKDRDMDEGDDETLLPGLEIGPDFSGDDLDVPGADADDDWED